MLPKKKICSILASFLFCAQVFIACAEPNSSYYEEEKPETQILPKPVQSDSTAKGTPEAESAQKDSKEAEAAAKDSKEAEAAAKDSTKIPTNSGGKNEIRTTVLGDSLGRLISSDLYLDYPTDSFLTKFEIGDVVTVAIAGYDTLEMPVAEGISDVPIAGFLLSAIRGSKNILLTVHNGNFAEILGISDVSTPIEVVVSMKEKGGYLFGLEMREAQYMATNTEIYPNLSIEEFANFREVRTTGMGPKKLYRSSSPIDLCLGRNFFADSLAQVAGVATFINLADSEEGAKSYKSFGSSYYSSQDAVFLALPVEFFSPTFKAKLAIGFRFMIEHEAPYLVHCTYGMDRTGWTIAVLEALMGATAEDIQADYAKTFSNYYNVVDGKQVALNERQVDFFKSVVLRNLQAVYHADGIEVSDPLNGDWAAATEKYLEKLGLTPEEIAALKNKLK